MSKKRRKHKEVDGTQNPGATTPVENRQTNGPEPGEGEETREQEHSDSQNWQKWTTIATIAIFAVNVAAMFSYIGVSIHQSRLTRESNEHSYRAWLTVKGPDPKNFRVSSEPGSKTELAFEIENTGRSPAQKVQMRAATTVEAFDWVVPYPLPDGSEGGYSSVGVIGPTQTQTMFLYRLQGLTEDQAAGIKSGKRFIYYFGHAAYADKFGVDRELRFCFMSDRPIDTWVITRVYACGRQNAHYNQVR